MRDRIASRVSGFSVRSVPLRRTSPHTTLLAVPPSTVPKVSATGSKGEIVRLTSDCIAVMICAAMTMASVPRSG